MDTDGAQRRPAAPPGDGRYPHQDLTEKVIGAAFDVHRELGAGFLEKVYENDLAHELRSRGVTTATQAEIEVRYKGQPVGAYFADLLVFGRVLVEVKAASGLDVQHEAQLLNYLKAIGLKVGLLLNFGTRRL